MSKRFNKALYEKHDQVGKATALSFLQQIGYILINDTEAFKSHDFIVSLMDKPFKIEVEQKNNWKGIDFPFQTHDVPFRKHSSQANIFIQINSDATALAMCLMKTVKASEVITKNTIYTNNEKFFAVPIEKMKYYFKQPDGWYEFY